MAKALVDQGFTKAVVEHGAPVGIDVDIVERNPTETGFVPQAKHRVVERAYGILMMYLRLVGNYVHLPGGSASRVYWAVTAGVVRRPAHHPGLAGRVSGAEHTLGALPARLDTREQQITAEAQATHRRIAELTALPGELDQADGPTRVATCARK
ncbi:hypothetical protein OG948_33410 [Embleya sp. NBC_00888]|uniref:hypothetical protein n=1 Tax=Embleya sp. NBC_00888 TaxID=2975960 RepID=UPI00387022FC|nr:hypothetical protein OG948_33410 [Embleya sp. NBC_00888]